MASTASASIGARRVGPAVAGALIVLMTASALVVYKAGGSMKALAKARAAGTLGPKAEWIPTAALPAAVRPLAGTINYFSWVLVALGFGIVIGASVKALISDSLLARTMATESLGGQIAAAFAGAPLMLCSCCVAPVFEGVYERTRRLGPALGLMVASPALNPAVLAMTFLLFPPDIAWGRLVLSVVLVGVAVAGIGRVFPDVRERECPVSWDRPGYPGLARGFVRSLGQIMVRSVPAIVIGVVASAIIMNVVSPPDLARSMGAPLLAILITAAIAVPLALPTFGEIPIGLALLGAGAPHGAVLAMLVAGPALNLPSLLTLSRVVSVRVAVAAGAALFLVSAVGGVTIGLVS